MEKIALHLYSLLSTPLFASLRLLGRCNRKLDMFFSVRQTLYQPLEEKVRNCPKQGPRIWIHAASVGEFEQARPLLKRLRDHFPDAAFFVSFLSDSGFNARKGDPDADAVFYLPADTPANARRTAAILKPDLFILMRYDFWPNHLLAAKRQGAKLALAAAILQDNSVYLNPLTKRFYREVFQLFDCICTIAENDSRAFRDKFQCTNVLRAGEPRVEQVITRSRDTSAVDFLKPFYKDKKAFVCGSIWEHDEAVILPAWQALPQPPPLVLVPHKVDEATIARLEKKLAGMGISHSRVSMLHGDFDPSKKVLIIDRTGFLLELYTIAAVAYVGGGFGRNVHNTLEPAAHGIPVIFGPRHRKSPEAATLLRYGGAEAVSNQEELQALLYKLMTSRQTSERMGMAAGKFIREHAGAAATITKSLVSLLGNMRKNLSATRTQPARNCTDK